MVRHWAPVAPLGPAPVCAAGMAVGARRCHRGRVLVVVYPPRTGIFRSASWRALPVDGRSIGSVQRHALFRVPWVACSAAGGIPIDRSRPGGFVEGMVEAFYQRAWCASWRSRRGTRSYVPCWKSVSTGSRWQAGAGGRFIDYATRRMGILDYVSLSGDSAADMARIRDAYAGVAGLSAGSMPGEIRFGDRPGASRRPRLNASRYVRRAAFVRVQPIFTWMSCRVLAQLAMRSAALDRWR